MWADESYNAAIKYAYANIIENQRPTNAYLSAGQAVAKQRIALAGYRLAQLLETANRLNTFADSPNE